MTATHIVMRFIAGRYKGGEFPLRPNREVIIGRGSEYDMVLDEDMVSRRHAKLSTYHGQIVLQDLKSTNGTFVNGERISVVRLKVGDKVLVGTAIMELVGAGAQSVSKVPQGDGDSVPINVPPPNQPTAEAMPVHLMAAMPTQVSDAPAPLPTMEHPAVPGADLAPPTVNEQEGMSGRFPEDGVTVADLVELFHNGTRTGVLVMVDAQHREGRIFFKDGAVYHAAIASGGRAAPLAPGKCFYRLLTWTHGRFRLDPLTSAPRFDQEIEGETRALLLDGVRQLDELKRYEGHLLPETQSLILHLPLEPALSALSAEALDTLQVVLNHGQVGAILDHSLATDLETWQDLFYLIQNHYLTLG